MSTVPVQAHSCSKCNTLYLDQHQAEDCYKKCVKRLLAAVRKAKRAQKNIEAKSAYLLKINSFRLNLQSMRDFASELEKHAQLFGVDLHIIDCDPLFKSDLSYRPPIGAPYPQNLYAKDTPRVPGYKISIKGTISCTRCSGGTLRFDHFYDFVRDVVPGLTCGNGGSRYLGGHNDFQYDGTIFLQDYPHLFTKYNVHLELQKKVDALLEVAHVVQKDIEKSIIELQSRDVQAIKLDTHISIMQQATEELKSLRHFRRGELELQTFKEQELNIMEKLKPVSNVDLTSAGALASELFIPQKALRVSNGSMLQIIKRTTKCEH